MSLISKASGRKSGVGWTAFYTAAVWTEVKIPGAERFITWRGRFINWLVSWGGATLGLFGTYSVSNLFLIPRHLGINYLLKQKAPGQVIELAAGLVSRGYELTRKHPYRYLEIDQPAVIAFKQARLAKEPRSTAPGASFQMIPANLLQPADAIAKLTSSLDLAQPTLLISEGLSGYLPEPALTELLETLHDFAKGFWDMTLLIDFCPRFTWRSHRRVAPAMAIGQLVWKILGAEPRLFLKDPAHLRNWLESLGFEVVRLYSAQDLAALAKCKRPAVNVFYLAELRVKA